MQQPYVDRTKEYRNITNMGLKRDDAFVQLLCQLIATPSFSREENQAADLVESFIRQYPCIIIIRKGHNIIARGEKWDDHKPTVLLNSHLDTVKPSQGWASDPFIPTWDQDKLTGLGVNDAGGALMMMLHTFLRLYDHELPFNLLFLASAEEEIGGSGGVSLVLEDLGAIDMGFVGEPTSMEIMIAEKGLMVIDAEARGQSGHAGRKEGINSIYLAMEDINWIRQHKFENVSEVLGEVNMSVTQIQAGKAHNVTPDLCSFVIDVRSTDQYTNKEIFEILQKNLNATLKARSFRLNPSGIALDHPAIVHAHQVGITAKNGSSTLSDQALMPFPTVKIGPGDTTRSHTANEYLYLHELEAGLTIFEAYIRTLEL